ncbi:anti-sigma factor [Aquihabitans sp. G128]|uniref:anti-sigma factor n=1 Tax=Aquihabitans sp. G128 TaxID=2849779 RepID=UPI001C21983A|nr:anti-sigma factor [Aquihabitans sp. G128]QXC63482.1 anti-sigma factor [Aquihabitans sp. G128]
MSAFHDDFSDLLGAYALDAVDPDERERVEIHLRSCPWCAAEVSEHREVASFLSHSGTDAPEGVWDRIAAELSPPAPPLRMTFSPVGEVDPLASLRDQAEAPDAPVAEPAAGKGALVVPLRPRSARLRTLTAVLAAAACLLAAVGFFAYGQGRDDRPTGSALPTTSAEVQVSLTGAKDMGAQALVDSTGKGYLVAHDLPDAGSGDLYQLWGQVDGVVLSLGTFDGGTDVVPFHVDPGQVSQVQSFAVTKEKAPGVVASKNLPVMAGTV